MSIEEKTEEQLAAELEDMYRRVASIEKPDMAENQYDVVTASDRQQEPSFNPFPGNVHGAADQASESPNPPLVAEVPGKKQRYTAIGALVIIFVCLCGLFYAVFFWPTLYDIAIINTGNRSYPIRMNRITGSVLYFDGNQWRNTPVPFPAVIDPAAVPSDKKTPLDRQNVPAPVVLSEPSPVPVAVPPLESKASSLHQEAPASPLNTAGRGSFTIQVKSFDNPVDAGNLIAELKKAGIDVRSEAAHVVNRGIWHRVLIGRFKGPEEAVRFMQENKLKKSYPDSFIRKFHL
jgi:cell division septation protein DedD